VLPWDHLAPEGLRDFLRAERERALAAEVTEPCDPTGCPACGQCEDYAVNGEAPPAIERRPSYHSASAATGKVRVEFSKFGKMKYLPHLSLMRTFHRALRRAGIPVAYSQGHTPHPRIQLGPPLPLGYEGDREYVDIETHSVISPAELAEKLGESLPGGLEVQRAVAVPLRGPSLFEIVTLQTYRVVIPKGHLPRDSAGDWLLNRIMEPAHLFIERTRKGKTKRIDLKPAVARAEIIGESDSEIDLVLALRRKDGSSPRPNDVLRTACGFAGQEEFAWKITRTANLTATEEPLSSPMDSPPAEKKKKVLTSRR
jgi:radical SAM-linked protein